MDVPQDKSIRNLNYFTGNASSIRLPFDPLRVIFNAISRKYNAVTTIEF